MIENASFRQTRWPLPWASLNAERVSPDMQAALQEARQRIADIENLPEGTESFHNTFLALEDASRLVGDPWSLINNLDSLRDSPELRKAIRQWLPEVSAFSSAIPLNPRLYQKLKAAAKRDAANRPDIEQRFISESLRDFEDAGANQDEPTRQRLAAIAGELADLTKTFSEHVLDSTNAFEKIVQDRQLLDGLPDSLIEAARLDALAKGHGSETAPAYRLTLQMPSFMPAMRYLHNNELRRELYLAFTRIGHYGDFENEDLVRRILALRREKATLLGQTNFPDWALARRMARDGNTALHFVEDLFTKTKPAFDREMRAVMDTKARHTGSPVEALEPWELAYWTERLRKETFDFQEEELRPYFPLPSVMQGLFSLVEKLFAVRVEEDPDPNAQTWHPDVRVFKLTDAASGQHLGSFYTDWHPREDKRGGAWMNPLLAGQTHPDGTRDPHIGLIAGNLTPPVGDQPALLTHRDVETLFHEFGHLLHHLLSEVPIASLGGANVAWDFVELPSQIMENWCWERESLDLFARHYQTGQPIPEELFRKLIASRRFAAAQLQMRQLSFAKMDLALHLDFEESHKDLDAFINTALQGYRPPFATAVPSNVRAFSHLFAHPTGYAAGYYSYKWAEVLDADAFSRFATEGLLNPQTGKDFRKAVLAAGNSQPPETLFHNFMHRQPDPNALLNRLGLL